MASTSTPYGLTPISHQSGTPRPVCLKNGIASGLSSNIFRGQAVMLDAGNGTITPITATSDRIYGVFMGVEYTPTGQRPVVSPFWPASSTFVAGLDAMNVYIWEAWDATLRWIIQADGAVAQSAYGDQFNLSNFANGSTVTGLSACTAAAAPVGSGNQGQVQLIEFGEGLGSAVGDAFTDLIVAISFPQAVITGQVSRG